MRVVKIIIVGIVLFGAGILPSISSDINSKTIDSHHDCNLVFNEISEVQSSKIITEDTKTVINTVEDTIKNSNNDVEIEEVNHLKSIELSNHEDKGIILDDCINYKAINLDNHYKEDQVVISTIKKPVSTYQDKYPFIKPDGGLDSPLNADFEYYPEKPTEKDVIKFIDISKYIDQKIVKWWWDFGNGYYSDLQNPVHCYYKKGKYKVSLTIIDNNGEKDTVTKEIIVISADIWNQCQEQVDSGFKITGNIWAAQSFQTKLNTITRVELYFGKLDKPNGFIILSIRDSLYGKDLTSIIKSAKKLPEYPTWVEFDFPDLSLDFTPSRTEGYYIVVRHILSSNFNEESYVWGYGMKNPYEHGLMWYSNDGGISWEKEESNDFCFRLYGYYE